MNPLQRRPIRRSFRGRSWPQSRVVQVTLFLDILPAPPHLPVGRLLFIKPESLFTEMTDCLSGRGNFFRFEMITEKIHSSFGYSRD